MKIISNIDITAFEEDGVFTENSKQMFRKYVDDYFDAMMEIKPSVHAGVCSLKGRINEKLQEHSEKAYEAVVGLVLAEDYNKIAIYDYELTCFTIAAKIYQLEKSMDSTIFDHIDYTEHFQTIYQQMLFYFRRIQLHLAKPLQMECMAFIRKNQLSPFAVIEMLLETEMGGKEIIAGALADMYYEQNCSSDALFFLSVMAEQGRPEYLDFINQKKAGMISNL